jgi:hypothetical protein
VCVCVCASVRVRVGVESSGIYTPGNSDLGELVQAFSLSTCSGDSFTALPKLPTPWQCDYVQLPELLILLKPLNKQPSRPYETPIPLLSFPVRTGV